MLYDVIIIGAGPAGSTLARLLACSNFNVLLLEKEIFPRAKACAGGLTARITQLLDFSLEEVIEDVAESLVFSLNGSFPLTSTGNKPLVLMTQRKNLDQFLLEKAKKAGAVIYCGKKVDNLLLEEGGVKVISGGEVFSGKIVIGADGVHSFTASALGLEYVVSRGLAVECTIKDKDSLAAYRHKLHLDYGVIAGGYGWVFPKADHLSVGLYSTILPHKNIKAIFTRYLDWKFPKDIEKTTLRGHPIPLGGKTSRLVSPSGLLLGDAAGLADPFTGEGIYYAVKSAYLAFEILEKFFKQNKALVNYQKLVKTEIISELEKARIIAYIFYRATAFNYKYFLTKEEILQKYTALLSGELTYQEVFSDLTRSSLKYLLPPYLYKKLRSF